MKAIFFDRDGVIIKDVNLLCNESDIIIPHDVFKAFSVLKQYNFLKVVVTNQTVISRGLIDEDGVNQINNKINNLLLKYSENKIDKFYICPHHPEATLEKYRINCECRKPKPGMLFKAASEFNIDLKNSWMIGDRISDIVAGHRAKCKTILLKTGMHTAKPIISDSMDTTVKPDFVCENLLSAVELITGKS